MSTGDGDYLHYISYDFKFIYVSNQLGREVPHREVIVTDQSTDDTFRISVWDPDMIRRYT